MKKKNFLKKFTWILIIILESDETRAYSVISGRTQVKNKISNDKKNRKKPTVKTIIKIGQRLH